MAQIIKLNIIPKGIPDVVNVSQFDVGREITFELLNGTSTYTIPSGATAVIGGRKKDNHVFQYAATINAGRQSITITTTEQMTACAGENLCQLRILKDDTVLATVNFKMMVQEMPDANGDTSDSDLPDIIAMATAQEQNAEAWAVGTKNGVPVTSDDPQYQNNAKYWVEQADTECWFDFGGIYASAGQYIYRNPNNYKTRVRTKVIVVPANVSYILTFTGSFEQALCVESIDGSTIEYSAEWKLMPTFTTILNGGRSYRFVFRNSDDSEMNLNDIKCDLEVIKNQYGITEIKGNDICKPLIFNGDYTAAESYYYATHTDLTACRSQLIKGRNDGVIKVDCGEYDYKFVYIYGNTHVDNGWKSDDTYKCIYAKDDQEYFFVFRDPNGGVVDPSKITIEYTKVFESVDSLYNTIKEDNNAVMEMQMSFVQGNTDPFNGTRTDSGTRCTNSFYIPTGKYKYIHIECPNGFRKRATFISNNNPITVLSSWYNLNWSVGNDFIEIPDGTKYLKVSVAKVGDAAITPSDCGGVKLKYCNSVPNNIEFVGKKISLLGDSITTYAGENATTAPDGHLLADGSYTYEGNHCRYPQNNLLTDVHDCYWYQLIKSLDMKLGINDSWAGSRVSWDGSTESGDQGANICISSQTRINHLDDNGTPDLILVNAGTNDIIQNVTVGTFNTESPVNYTEQQIANLSVATFADAYRAMLIRLLKTYPTTEIVCMLPNFTSSTYYSPTKQDPYLEIIKEACDYFGVKWVDARAFGISMYNLNTYLGDGVHPNAKGMRKLANDLVKKFRYDVAL